MKKCLLKPGLLLCAALCFYACGKDDAPGTVAVSGVTLDETELSLPVGSERRLVASVEPAEATDKSLTWVSDAPEVASVDGGGIVKALSPGETVITVYAKRNEVQTGEALPNAPQPVSASCKVTVTESTVAVTGIKLDPTELSLEVGDNRIIVAEVEPSDATDKTVAWTSDAPSIATVDNGTVTAVAPGTAKVTASAGGFSAVCTVTVSEKVIAVTGITLDPSELTLDVGESRTVTATVEPSDATDKTVAWTSDTPGVATVDNGTITAVAPGTAVITASAGDCSAVCNVTVNAPYVAPKIGDYFYSDGTWSDGGLVSIEPDGLNPVWADTKPAPVADKTVIGIVCQTFPDRIAQGDKDKGYTHGYVMAVKNAHSASKQTTAYSLDTEFDCLSGAKMSDTWYNNVNGWNETMTVRQRYGSNLAQCPAFDWTVNGFPLEAPSSTSGWFLPSTGQLWDMVANLCGHEVAVYMKDWSTKSLNAGWGYASEKVGYDVIARFNASMSMIPAADKEEMFVTHSYYQTCSIWASTPCTVGETACIINIGSDGTIELYEEYADGDCVARPILAF